MGQQFQPKTLSELGLVDAPAEMAFDNLTVLAQRMLGVPVALVSLVEPERDRQFFKSAVGLPEPFATQRQTPLTHSFCKHVRATGRPLIVADARNDPRVAHNLAVRDLGVVAYLGVPLLDPQGLPVGAFCVIDTVPRIWCKDDVDRVSRFGAVASEQIKLKAALLHMEEAHAVASAAAASRSSFLAYMSHELRTPLHGMLGLADILIKDLPAGDARDMVGLLQDAGSGLLRQLNDILDLARIDAGRLALDPVPFRPDSLLHRLAKLHGAVAAAKGVTLELDVADECACDLIGDDHRIGQVVGNLLGNAVKFTDIGQVRMSGRVDWHGDSDALLHLTIADSGPGMDKETLSRLFEPFLQAGSSVARTHGGSGLGTTIVKAILDAMDGSIDVQSVLGQGTIVRLVLPLRRGAPAADRRDDPSVQVDFSLHAPMLRPVSSAPARLVPVAPVTPPVSSEDAPVATLRILVADDDPVSRLIMEKSLQRAGMAVTLAQDGHAALAALAAVHFDALVLDFRMPGLSGPELLARLRDRAWSGPNSTTPAIAVSAEGDEVLRRQASLAGFAESFCKPVRGDKIATAVRRLSAGVGPK